MEHPLEKVISWLEAGDAADYRTGVLLLQEHSGNRSLLNNLLKKESQGNRDKLVYELVKVGCGGRMQDVSEVLNHFAQAVAGTAPVVQQVAAVLTAQDFPAEPAPPHVPAQVQGQVDELTQLMAKLYNERVQLSNSLATLDPAEGPHVVGQILSLDNQYNALAQKRRSVLASPLPAAAVEQPIPPEPDALTAAPVATGDVSPAIDRAELVKQRQNLRSNLSKARKKAEEAKTEEKRSEYAQKAGKLEVELSQVEMQLAQPQV
jgi:hypothetical protein